MTEKATYNDAEKFNDIIDLIAQLDKKLGLAVKYINEKQQEDKYSSDKIDLIATALAKAQGEYLTVYCNRENPYFKSSYADLDAILKAVRPALTKYALSFIQQPRTDKDGSIMLHSILMHSSGQWIESRVRVVPPKNDAQSFGSTLSYQRRYAAVSILGVAISDDIIDDDAERAMVASRDIMARGTALNRKYNPKEQSGKVITKEQLDELEYELGDYPDIAEQVMDGLKLQSLADMPKEKFQVATTRIREIINAREGVK